MSKPRKSGQGRLCRVLLFSTALLVVGGNALAEARPGVVKRPRITKASAAKKQSTTRLGRRPTGMRRGSLLQPKLNRFQRFHARNTGAIWSTSLSPRLKNAINLFKSGRTGYGQSVKHLDLSGLNTAQVGKLLKSRGFVVEKSVIRDFNTQKPLLGPNGKALRQLIYRHVDGGMVRVKPDGQPGSARPQPHMVKAVRITRRASTHEFGKEAFKVDNAGNPLPKFPPDLRNPHPVGSAKANQFTDAWADAAHTNLR